MYFINNTLHNDGGMETCVFLRFSPSVSFTLKILIFYTFRDISLTLTEEISAVRACYL